MNPVLAQFISEARDFFQSIGQGLIQLETNPNDEKIVGELFRAVHTLKGNSGLFDFGAMTHVLHAAEDLMEVARRGELNLDPTVIDMLLNTIDYLSLVLDKIESDVYFNDVEIPKALEIAANINRKLTTKKIFVKNEFKRQLISKSMLDVYKNIPDDIKSNNAFSQGYFIFYNPESGCFFKGEDPLFIMSTIPMLNWGAVFLGCDELAKSFDCYKSVASYIAFSSANYDFLIDHFRYVSEQVEIVSVDLLQMNFDGDSLKSNKNELENEFVNLTNAVPMSESESATMQFRRRDEDLLPGKILKVERWKIERLMALINEVLVVKNELPSLAIKAEYQDNAREVSKELRALSSVVNRIADDMQEAIMQVRMMPVSFVFQRFPRLVRDIAKKLGKNVELVVEGGELEVDRNLIEALADPLMHILRNSLDHGVETPDERIADKKSTLSLLSVRAWKEKDKLIIQVSDDGRGIDPEKIKLKAFEKGLITKEQFKAIDNRAAIDLIFIAGLSTAIEVTELSGRGVGMDVVRTTVQRFGGSVSVESRQHVGTSVQLTLPISLARVLNDGSVVPSPNIKEFHQ